MMTRGATAGLAEQDTQAQFAADVERFLALKPRQLPSKYFYDSLGSALFDAICGLPWYRIPAAESRLLRAHRTEVFRRLSPLSAIVELGPGSGQKLKLLLEDCRSGRRTIDVHLVDVSGRALETAAQTIETVPDIRVRTHQAEYVAGVREAAALMSRPGRTLVVFLGSNLGNFDPVAALALLASIRKGLAEGDGLLLGTDLVKPEADLLLAYDDPLGVTAAFNRNILLRINAELGGDFEIGQFAHRAVWNAAQSRIEMHLVARSTQHVRIDGVPMALTIRAGERIWTESSYKYRPGSVSSMLERARFRTIAQWIDEGDGFALTLAAAA